MPFENRALGMGTRVKSFVSIVAQHFEDLSVGQKFGSGSQIVEASEITEFAGKFDPQPFHLSDESARHTILGGLAASGWHTASVSANLLINSEFKLASGIVGLSVDELRWTSPLRPGDELNVETEILELRPSKSRPLYGVVKARITTFNQNHDIVQSYILALLALRKTPSSST